MLLESRISPKALAKRLHFFHQSFLSLDAFDRALGRDVINDRSKLTSQRQFASVRERAQCSFDRDKARQTSRELPAIYSTEQSSSFSSWSWLRCFLKSLFTFNLNLPESLKQRCTVCTTTRLKLSANSLPIRHQAEVVCQFNFSLVVQRRFKRPLITSRQSTQSYASRERNLWGKSLKSRASRAVLVKSETPEA